GTDRMWKALVVGAGNLGQALSSYRGFLKKGFQVVAVFDNDPERVSRPIDGNSGGDWGDDSGVEVFAFDRVAEIIAGKGIELGILAVPAEAAQRVADQLVEAGIKGILNFAPTSISVPEGIALASVDLSVHLEQLAFRICTSRVGMPQ
ncbi:MAG: redox-sensing transcriptional repressor Rex, partial [Phycisphaerae bacterium]|nr:redox-sensing transcriptional repressor Rex [Phycisphaerae bacterium]